MTAASSSGDPPVEAVAHPRVDLVSAASLPTEFGNFRIHVFTARRSGHLIDVTATGSPMDTGVTIPRREN